MIIALDLETTGLDSNSDKIIEIALIKIDSKTFKEIDRYETLINPNIEIPEIISNITNIFDNDVKSSPSFFEISEKVQNFI
jgi:DNA polymerase-3 subunit epsilon